MKKEDQSRNINQLMRNSVERHTDQIKSNSDGELAVQIVPQKTGCLRTYMRQHVPEQDPGRDKSEKSRKIITPFHLIFLFQEKESA